MGTHSTRYPAEVRERAVQRLGSDGVTPSAVALYQIELEMLAEHGVATWATLERWAEGNGLPTDWFHDMKRRMARARECGRRLFSTKSETNGRH